MSETMSDTTKLIFFKASFRSLFAALIFQGGNTSATAAEALPEPNAFRSIELLSQQEADETRNAPSSDDPREDEDEEDEEDEDEDEDEYDEDEYDEDEYETEEITTYPRLEGAIYGDIEQDSTFAADDNTIERTDLFFSVYSSFDLGLTPHLNFELDIDYESSDADAQHEVSTTEGAVIETLAATYSGEIGGIQLGKFDLLDGIWDRGPGLFDNFQTEDLYLGEMIGISASFNYGYFFDSEHAISVGTFYQDSSRLSGALITSNGRVRKKDGGLANTEQFDNFVVSLHGEELPFLEDWEYAIGYARQAAGKTEIKDERSYFSGLYGYIDVGEDAEFSPFIEFLHRDGADGEDQTASTVLVGSTLENGPWTLSVSYSFRDTEVKESPRNDELGLFEVKDNNLQLSVGYTFSFGVYIDVEYQYLTEDDEDSYTVGMAIGYPLEFVLSPGHNEKPSGASKERLRRKTRR